MTEAGASRSDDLFRPGDLVNNTYRIEAVLGRGGTSTVYRARSEISGRLVAIKVLRPEFAGNMDYLALLTREEEIREIRHEAVVRYSENHRTPDGHVYLLMDYVDGPGLDRKLREEPMPADDLVVICRRVAGGLQAAHTRNIVHRDLSPDNIILQDDDPSQAVIIDFGIAKDTNPGAETIVGNDFAGKYAYAAPEQLAGKTDARTDIYSLGALLLACFRGQRPDMGRSPMETIEKKGKPLDLEGVPEPLHGLLARMTDPDPDRRFQTAADVIAAIDSGGVATLPVDDDDERTVIAPPSRVREEITGVSERLAPSSKPQGASEAAGAGGRSKAPLLAGLALVAAVAIGVGLWAAGIVGGGPRHPPVAPFELALDRDEAARLSASGYVPSEALRQVLAERAAAGGGTADLTLASGGIGESWGEDVLTLLDILSPLDTFSVAVSDDSARVNGTGSERAAVDSVRAALAPGLPGVLNGSVDIAYTPPFLPVEPLRAILVEFADCGPLALADPPPTGYGPGDGVTVTGKLAAPATRDALRDTLSAAASPRPVTVDAQILNESLCRVEPALPDAPSAGISFRFSEGSAPGETTGDVFVVGENPVIDVVLPAGMTDGYLSVSFIDVSGNVFHLLPNLSRPDNAIADLREGREGEVAVRLSYPVDEAEGTGKLAFRVDDRTLGTGKIIAMLSTAPLFDSLRPTTESASGYAQALGDGQRNDEARVTGLDSRLFVTAEN